MVHVFPTEPVLSLSSNNHAPIASSSFRLSTVNIHSYLLHQISNITLSSDAEVKSFMLFCSSSIFNAMLHPNKTLNHWIHQSVVAAYLRVLGPDPQFLLCPLHAEQSGRTRRDLLQQLGNKVQYTNDRRYMSILPGYFRESDEGGSGSCERRDCWNEAKATTFPNTWTATNHLRLWLWNDWILNRRNYSFIWVKRLNNQRRMHVTVLRATTRNLLRKKNYIAPEDDTGFREQSAVETYEHAMHMVKWQHMK